MSYQCCSSILRAARTVPVKACGLAGGATLGWRPERVRISAAAGVPDADVLEDCDLIVPRRHPGQPHRDHSARAQQRHQPTGVHILLPSGDWLTLLDSTRQDKRDAVPALRCATSRNFGTQQQLWYAGICSPLLLL